MSDRLPDSFLSFRARDQLNLLSIQLVRSNVKTAATTFLSLAWLGYYLGYGAPSPPWRNARHAFPSACRKRQSACRAHLPYPRLRHATEIARGRVPDRFLRCSHRRRFLLYGVLILPPRRDSKKFCSLRREAVPAPTPKPTPVRNSQSDANGNGLLPWPVATARGAGSTPMPYPFPRHSPASTAEQSSVNPLHLK